MYGLEDVDGSKQQREELAQFLATFEDETRNEPFWLKRFTAWWDTNPYYQAGMPKGWLLTHQDNIVGFRGVVASEYLYRGDVYQALSATTWRVLLEHRTRSMDIFKKYHSYTKEHIMMTTTPSKVVQKIHTAFKYTVNKAVYDYLFPLKPRTFSPADILLGAAHLFQNTLSKKKPLQLVRLDDDFQIESQQVEFDSLRKKVTRDYLTWYCHAPSHIKKEFIGCVQDDGVLSAYLLLIRSKMREFDTLRVIDYYSNQPDVTEILALISHICANPNTISISGGCKFLVFSSFATNSFFEKEPFYVVRKRTTFPHYYYLPRALKGAPKTCHIAEGDYGC